MILSDAIEGEARDVGRVHAAIAREVAPRDRPFYRPVVLLSGGETTVTVRGNGKGGRNGEFLLGFALAIEGVPGVARARRRHRRHRRHRRQRRRLRRRRHRRAHPRRAAPIRARSSPPTTPGPRSTAPATCFVTGPTGTNVNDFRAVLIA